MEEFIDFLVFDGFIIHISRDNGHFYTIFSFGLVRKVNPKDQFCSPR